MKDQLRQLLAKGETELVIERINEAVQGFENSNLKDSVILISSRFSQYKIWKRNGTISQEEFINQINSDLLEVINELPNKKEDRSKRNTYWIFMLSIILLFGIISFIQKKSIQNTLDFNNTSHSLNKIEPVNKSPNDQRDLSSINPTKKGSEEITRKTGEVPKVISSFIEKSDTTSNSKSSATIPYKDRASDSLVVNDSPNNSILTISGFVLDEFDNPISNVLIVGEDQKRVRTDSVGSFIIRNPIFRKKKSFYTFKIISVENVHQKRVHVNNTNSIRFYIEK